MPVISVAQSGRSARASFAVPPELRLRIKKTV